MTVFVARGRVSPYDRSVSIVRMIAGLAMILVVAACSYAATSGGPSLMPASDQPTQISASGGTAPSGTDHLPASVTDPVLADISRRSGVPVDQLTIVSAEMVTFPDGSLGCPQPGMAYTQVVVDGYKIIVDAHGTTYDVRGSGDAFRLCEPKAGPSAS